MNVSPMIGVNGVISMVGRHVAIGLWIAGMIDHDVRLVATVSTTFVSNVMSRSVRTWDVGVSRLITMVMRMMTSVVSSSATDTSAAGMPSHHGGISTGATAGFTTTPTTNQGK